jgi:alpha-beta hydrolase superfamily lysophospholipase
MSVKAKNPETVSIKQKNPVKVKRVVAIVIISVLFVYIVVGFIVSKLVYDQNFGRTIVNDEYFDNHFSTALRYKDYDPAVLPRERVTFPSGSNMLEGYIYGDPANNRGLVVVCHGFGGWSESYMPFIARFAADGYKVLAYNSTGTAGSEGKGTMGMYQSGLDMDGALTFVESDSRLDNLPVYLLGHSWGGYGVCAVLNYDHNVDAVVSFAGVHDGFEMFMEQAVNMVGNDVYVLYPHFWVIHRLTFGSAMDISAVDGINAKPDVPVMIVQGKDDETVLANTTSVYAHRDEITSPNVTIIYNEDYATMHNNVFLSKAAIDYNEQVQADFAAFAKDKTANTETETEAIKRAFNEQNPVDKQLINELDENLIQRIEAFFDEAGN